MASWNNNFESMKNEFININFLEKQSEDYLDTYNIYYADEPNWAYANIKTYSKKTKRATQILQKDFIDQTMDIFLCTKEFEKPTNSDHLLYKMSQVVDTYFKNPAHTFSSQTLLKNFQRSLPEVNFEDNEVYLDDEL